MRTEFDPTINGGLDKLHRYHQEAVIHTAVGLLKEQVTERPSLWTVLVRRARHLLHQVPVVAARH